MLIQKSIKCIAGVTHKYVFSFTFQINGIAVRQATQVFLEILKLQVVNYQGTTLGRGRQPFTLTQNLNVVEHWSRQTGY